MKIFTKSNNMGFSHVETFLFIIIILSVATFGLYDAHRHFSHADTIGSDAVGSNAASSNAVLFRNPFRNISGLDPWRIDEGVDYRGVGTGKNLLDGPVYAVGPAVVTDVHIGARGFPPTCKSECESHFWANDGGNDVIYRITAGLAKGEYIYIAEDCNPTVDIGDVVTDTTVVCNMFGPDEYVAGYFGIETGQWNGPVDNGTDSSKPLAFIHGQYGVDGTETHYGYNMNLRLVSLGAPSGNTTTHHSHISPYVSNSPGQVTGTVPAGWPNKWQ